MNGGGNTSLDNLVSSSKLKYFSKKNTKCPLDDMNLSIEDIFPDNFTKREIENIRKSFPDQFEPPNPILECNFASVGCDFKSMDPQEVERHVEENCKEHVDLLLSSYLKSQFQSWDPSEKTTGDDNQQSPTRELISKMYERIVILEQQNREQAMRIEQQDVRIERLLQMETRRNGTLVWRIKDFQKKVDLMKSNPLQMFYSPECFTDPTGYKFCARMALNSKRVSTLSFFVHFMRSENDFHLTWPFSGKIAISMINKDSSQTCRDIVMSNPEIKAFHRPHEDISTRSYGFMEYADIAEIVKVGFIDNDCLTIKIQMNIV